MQLEHPSMQHMRKDETQLANLGLAIVFTSQIAVQTNDNKDNKTYKVALWICTSPASSHQGIKTLPTEYHSSSSSSMSFSLTR